MRKWQSKSWNSSSTWLMWKSLSCVQLFATLWTIQSMEFSRPEYWSGQPFPSPGDLPNPGIEPRSPALQADSLPAEPPGVGSLFLLQGIFPTQESNQGLLHCRRILYQLSHQEQSLSLLQGIFPTQWLNQGLLHWKRILYQLRSQGSPTPFIIRKMKIRTTMIYHFPVTRIAYLTFIIIIIIDIRPVLARLWRNWNPHIGMCNDAGTVGSLTV